MRRGVAFGVTVASTLAFFADQVRAQDGIDDRPTATSSAPDAREARGSAFVDPLGFLLFGPTVGAELGFGQYSLLAHGRWLDGGMLARAMFENDTDRFAFSYGGGVKARYYFARGLVGPHLGVAMEVLRTRTENHTDRVAVNNLIVVPEVELGYRFGFGRFFFGAALAAGYAQQISKNVVNIEGGDQARFFYAKDVSTVYGLASLDLGVLF